MNFYDLIDYILEYEGGYVHHPNDPGGETHFGISKRAYPHLNIRDLTKADAKRIYRRDYWIACRCDELPDSLKLMVFDTAVNMGCGRAIRFLQKSMGVKVDGKFGPQTLKAVQTTPESVVLESYAITRLKFYHRLPGWKHFGKGWGKRLLEVSLLSAFNYKDDGPSLP